MAAVVMAEDGCGTGLGVVGTVVATPVAVAADVSPAVVVAAPAPTGDTVVVAAPTAPSGARLPPEEQAQTRKGDNTATTIRR